MIMMKIVNEKIVNENGEDDIDINDNDEDGNVAVNDLSGSDVTGGCR